MSVGQYLAETEKIFAAHQGTADRASMEAMTKELDEAREELDRQLETFLSKKQVAQVRTIMDDLRREAREADSDSGP
jgi:DNA-binding transcriptional MerR regulator